MQLKLDKNIYGIKNQCYGDNLEDQCQTVFICEMDHKLIPEKEKRACEMVGCFSMSSLKMVIQDIATPHEICLQWLQAKPTCLMYWGRTKRTKSLQVTSK